ncbi:hypothetical protein [Frankia sp. Cr1]|uniref:hypothetical protein n=1 Tax=Frankia sp. Cr1 TaxID=3073931 RepID=UPI002AD415FB|nr:hypothetical protein [Frankia sp. Cr1]
MTGLRQLAPLLACSLIAAVAYNVGVRRGRRAVDVDVDEMALVEATREPSPRLKAV